MLTRHVVTVSCVFALSFVMAYTEAEAQRRGQRVLVRRGGVFVPAKIVKVTPGSRGNKVYVRPYQSKRRVWYWSTSPNLRRYDWRAGVPVRCMWSKDRRFYNARITRVRRKRVAIRWDSDGSTGRVRLGRCRDRRARSQIPGFGGSATRRPAPPPRSRPAPPPRRRPAHQGTQATRGLYLDPRQPVVPGQRARL